MGRARMRAGASSKLWVRGVAVATLSVFAIATITGNGSAAAVTPEATRPRVAVKLVRRFMAWPQVRPC
mgnify:CR=1 FL=1